MKTIIAIIRTEAMEKTKSALEDIGVKGVTFLHVTGRGRQKGIVRATVLGETVGFYSDNYRLRQQEMVSPLARIRDGPAEKEVELGFLPKRMLIMVVGDHDVMPIVRSIIDSNRTGQHGDGKIFICPIISAIRIRTGEQGDKALV